LKVTVGQVVPVNPAASVRGPQHIVKAGKTPVLEPAEARTLLDSIDATTLTGLRDRALIALMVYSFARVGAALAMKVEDVFVQNRRLWVRLREKGASSAGETLCYGLIRHLTNRGWGWRAANLCTCTRKRALSDRHARAWAPDNCCR
jgi:integrase